MTNTDILLEDLEDVLDDATSIPLSKKCAVDVDKIKTIIEDIRLNTPQETKQAKAIVDSRNTILEEAKKDNTYELIKYTNEHKVKKEDEYEKVSLVKEFNEEKDPISYVEPVYQAGEIN